jgi:Flp pilus assembly protein TadG
MKLRKDQRGIAIVETIVTLPVILFLVLLCAEITNAFVDHNTLNKATRNAVRYLAEHAIPGTTGVVDLQAGTIAETRNLLVYGTASGGGTPILPGLAAGSVQVTDTGNNVVRVSVTYTYSGILGNSLPSFSFGAESNLAINLRATASMRAL